MEQFNNNAESKRETNFSNILRAKVIKQKKQIKQQDEMLEEARNTLTRNTTEYNVRIQQKERELYQEKEKRKEVESKLAETEDILLKHLGICKQTLSERNATVSAIGMQYFMEKKDNEIPGSDFADMNQLMEATKNRAGAQDVMEGEIDVMDEEPATEQNVEALPEMEFSIKLAKDVDDTEERKPATKLVLTTTHFFY